MMYELTTSKKAILTLGGIIFYPAVCVANNYRKKKKYEKEWSEKAARAKEIYFEVHAMRLEIEKEEIKNELTKLEKEYEETIKDLINITTAKEAMDKIEDLKKKMEEF